MVAQPILCPIRYVFSSGVPTVSRKTGSHVASFGVSVSGNAGTCTSKPLASSSFFTYGYQQYSGYPSQQCTIITRFCIKQVYLFYLTLLGGISGVLLVSVCKKRA